eukprot:TRINITY_DN0_c600_g1_i6.p1 TRINITY_DN0_c600_g1~~TRINITY_DN0_c600_g1_i6.p1  ORF type:complete len:131 (+),score=38.12 TRINITY_DN0_c600_g1_i6:3-395(+)
MCIRDSVPVIQQTVNDLSSGNYSNLVNDVQALIVAFQVITQDCNNSRDIKFDFENREQCIADLNTIRVDVVNAYNAYKAGQINTVISNVQDIIRVLQNIETDCGSQSCQKVCRLKKICNTNCAVKVACEC